MSRRKGSATKERHERALKQAEDDLRHVLSTPQGRRFYWRLLDQVAGVFSGTFTGSSQTFYAEGRRSVGIDIMREGQGVAPDLYVLALTEQLDAQRREHLERDQQQSSDAEAQGEDDS